MKKKHIKFKQVKSPCVKLISVDFITEHKPAKIISDWQSYKLLLAVRWKTANFILFFSSVASVFFPHYEISTRLVNQSINQSMQKSNKVGSTENEFPVLYRWKKNATVKRQTAKMQLCSIHEVRFYFSSLLECVGLKIAWLWYDAWWFWLNTSSHKIDWTVN